MPPKLVLQTLSSLLNLIRPLEIPTALAGGIAMSYWGNPRSTQDIDLAMIVVPSDGLDRVLRNAGLQAKKVVPKSMGLFTLYQWTLELDDEYVQIEVDLMVSTSDYYQAIFERVKEIKIDGISSFANVLSREDLIVHKLYAGRLIDQADVQNLLVSSFDELDHDYLKRWVQTLQLEQEWNLAVGRYHELR